MCGLFGIGLQFPTVLSASNKNDLTSKPFSGKVLIIGAGAGGLSAAYFLAQAGINFEVLEASSAFGGRMKINTDFSDFPIPLGAEWLEANENVLHEIVNDSAAKIKFQTTVDHPDRKFVNYSWYNFFEDYIVPSIANKISYDTIVRSIDYSASQIVVNTQKGIKKADKVVISVPLQILKDGDINFTPSLPKRKLNAIQQVEVWGGFKAFFEFRNNFYGDNEHVFPIRPASSGQKIVYNAALGQNTKKNILGLFVVGAPTQDYIERSGDELKNFMLSEIDRIYDNQASSNYLGHISQNWNSEPFIKGGYLSDHADWKQVRELGNSVANKLYFAGGEYTDGEDWVSVHIAALSAKKTIEEISL